MKKMSGIMASLVLLIAAANALPAGAVSASQLHSKLLKVSNLPTGWSVDSSSSSPTDQDCLSSLKSSFKHEVKATAAFVNGSLPALQETIESGPGIDARFATFVKTLNKCKSVEYSSGGETVHGTMGAMSFPKVGSRSNAFAASLTVQGINAGADIVLFQVGSIIGDVVYEDLGVPDIEELQGFVEEAIAKLEGGKIHSSQSTPTTAVPETTTSSPTHPQ